MERLLLRALRVLRGSNTRCTLLPGLWLSRMALANREVLVRLMSWYSALESRATSVIDVTHAGLPTTAQIIGSGR